MKELNDTLRVIYVIFLVMFAIVYCKIGGIRIAYIFHAVCGLFVWSHFTVPIAILMNNKKYQIDGIRFFCFMMFPLTVTVGTSVYVFGVYKCPNTIIEESIKHAGVVTMDNMGVILLCTNFLIISLFALITTKTVFRNMINRKQVDENKT